MKTTGRAYNSAVLTVQLSMALTLCCYAFSYCGDEDFSGKYCGANDGSMMENLSEQCIITEYVYVCRNYL